MRSMLPYPLRDMFGFELLGEEIMKGCRKPFQGNRLCSYLLHMSHIVGVQPGCLIVIMRHPYRLALVCQSIMRCCGDINLVEHAHFGFSHGIKDEMAMCPLSQGIGGQQGLDPIGPQTRRTVLVLEAEQIFHVVIGHLKDPVQDAWEFFHKVPHKRLALKVQELSWHVRGMEE